MKKAENAPVLVGDGKRNAWQRELSRAIAGRAIYNHDVETLEKIARLLEVDLRKLANELFGRLWRQHPVKTALEYGGYSVLYITEKPEMCTLYGLMTPPDQLRKFHLRGVDCDGFVVCKHAALYLEEKIRRKFVKEHAEAMGMDPAKLLPKGEDVRYYEVGDELTVLKNYVDSPMYSGQDHLEQCANLANALADLDRTQRR